MNWNNDQECLAAVEGCGLALEYVKNQTLEMCLVAVKNYGLAFQFTDKNKFSELYCYCKLLNN